MWATLPWWTYRNAHTVRWTLTASDVMFTNPAVSWFARQGQAIETVRGGGIFQPAIPTSRDMLSRGDWIHIFPEGGVNPEPPSQMRRFKWGVSRLILESSVLPIVIPIYLTGFDHVMPETRSFPRFVPRPGADISVTFGAPLCDETLAADGPAPAPSGRAHGPRIP
ncbi:Lyso-phosphatidylcholine acyltransferase [Malassezia cuniculi]|uniref:Tafazzin family protein n=1 Tax=Malassezia cuniculi TaxID=948313 RepID=A0AAF0EYK3_9BASI|nr:Lyso-phosphatidylcholine acyltransferase [Malassezia cuniculi]